MIINIPKAPSYNAPEGIYRAVLTEVIELQGKLCNCTKEVRLKWKLIYPEHKRVEYFVGKNYCADDTNCTELVEDLRSWFGSAFDSIGGDDGKIDLEELIGQEADIVVSHIRNTKYEKPFVRVKAIHPPGTLLRVPNE